MSTKTKKLRARSVMSVPSNNNSNSKEDSRLMALDVLTLKVLSLQLSDYDNRYYAIKATFCDQIVLSGIIKPIGMREEPNTGIAIAQGTFSYSPADYEKMSSFANTPLIVSVQPLKTFESQSSMTFKNTSETTARQVSSTHRASSRMQTHISTCNVDILPIFIAEDMLCIKKRMEPLVTPSVLQRKSWDNLPLITIKLCVERNPENDQHNELLKAANYMKITVVGLYNMLFPYERNYSYTVATKLPVAGTTPRSDIILFSDGGATNSRFNNTAFFPKWESLRATGEPFTKGDDKFTIDVQKLEKINTYDVDHYFSIPFVKFTTIWGSSHRCLILKSQEDWLWHTFRQWKWPLEVIMTAEYGVNYTFMACIDLFSLCYPGVNKVCLAVPLSWFNHWVLKEQCDCYNLIAAYDKTSILAPKASKPTNTSSARSTSTETGVSNRPTGGDEGSAFIIFEVSLARPLLSLKIPPQITRPEIFEMLADMERISADKRMCTARGQQVRDWQSTARLACNALRRVPHYGTTEFCLFNRQLSETRTRVELFTSCWLDAAIYVNNNFVIQDFLKSNEMYEELLMMSHACLMKISNDTLLGITPKDIEPKLRAARHARHMQDLPHAMELYMLLVSKHPYNANYWRELSTCMKEIDRDWALYCLDRALLLNIRHPLTLLSKACMICEEDPDAAEPFFMAIMAFYPFWHTGWTVANAYFLSRELYHMADQVLACMRLSQQAQQNLKETEFPRSWEFELGDWWEQAPLLPGMSHYFDAADLLLRLRALNLAEVCVARSLLDHGPSAAYFYFLALCCRLQNRIDDALCHTKQGLDQFGDVSYLKNLEGECYHKQHNTSASIASFEKAGACMNCYNVLLSLQSRDPNRVRSILVDLLRRQPNAYAWMALCDDWGKRASIGEGGDGNLTEEQRSAMVCATACAIQALKWDRRAGRAWAHLAGAVHPSARRLFCRNMAISCGHYMPGDRVESDSPSKQSLCYRLGVAYLACSCAMCSPLHL